MDPGKARGLGTRAAAGLMLGAQASQPSCGDGLPAVHRMYNLYHPFDPVGYRCDTHLSKPARTSSTQMQISNKLNISAIRSSSSCKLDITNTPTQLQLRNHVLLKSNCHGDSYFLDHDVINIICST